MSDGSSLSPGEYRLSTVGLPDEFYLKEARYNSVDVLNKPLTYSAGRLQIVWLGWT